MEDISTKALKPNKEMVTVLPFKTVYKNLVSMLLTLLLSYSLWCSAFRGKFTMSKFFAMQVNMQIKG